MALVRWFDLQYRDLRGRLAAVPNGGHRHKAVAGKLKAEGVRSGFPDLMLLTPRNDYHGLVIELKTKTGKATPAQLDWLNWLADQGYQAVLCKGFDAAKQTIVEYLGPKKGSPQ